MQSNSQDKFFFSISMAAVCFLVFILLALLVAQLVMSWPSIRQFGFSFLWSNAWDPSTDQFGALSAIIGTVITSLIACIFAVPISFGAAILITQILPDHLAAVISRIIELMAGIPSIIYGMWGLFVFGPFMTANVLPHILNIFPNVPVLGYLFRGLPIGVNIVTASMVLALMIVPLITSMMRDIIANIPDPVFEAAYGIGATRWEITYRIIVHYTRAGLLGAIILGLGRALGETMAVTFVIGGSHMLPQGLFMPGTTISSTIANEFNEATGRLYPSALVELSLILVVITFITLVISRYFLKRATVRGGNVE